MTRTVQLIPADGWWALFKGNTLGPEREPLIAWALDEESDTFGLVENDDRWPESVNRRDDFVGYYRTGSRACICDASTPRYAEDPAWCPECIADHDQVAP